MIRFRFGTYSALFLALALPASASAQATDADVARLVAAMLGDTPLLRDVASLTDRFGGRATGSEANVKAVDWGLARFREAGVDARSEPFTMPGLWLERRSTATIGGTPLPFSPRVVALPFSAATPKAGVAAPLLDGAG